MYTKNKNAQTCGTGHDKRNCWTNSGTSPHTGQAATTLTDQTGNAKNNLTANTSIWKYGTQLSPTLFTKTNTKLVLTNFNFISNALYT